MSLVISIKVLMYLDIERIKNSLLNGSDVGVENIEMQILKGSNGLNELAMPSARKDLN